MPTTCYEIIETNMDFVINNINKIQLIQAIYIHAAPKGYGELEHKLRNQIGENVEGLTDEECQEILEADYENRNGYLIDYLKGKPIKLDFYERSGLTIISTSAYDLRNGKYRFFEAMLNTFSLDEILIYRKNYPRHLLSMINDSSERPPEQNRVFENILKNTVKQHDSLGKYWKIDTEKIAYTPPYMKY